MPDAGDGGRRMAHGGQRTEEISPSSSVQRPPSAILPFLWLTLVAFALLLGGFYLWQQQSQRGATEPEYSTYRTDALGSKALFLTLENMGYHPVRWQQDFTGLPSAG